MSGEERGWDLLPLLASKAALASALDLLYRSPVAPLHYSYILPFVKKKKSLQKLLLEVKSVLGRSVKMLLLQELS